MHSSCCFKLDRWHPENEELSQISPLNLMSADQKMLFWNWDKLLSLSFQVLLRIFSFLSHQEILKNALVCKKWHMISQDPKLWSFVSLRPEISGEHPKALENAFNKMNISGLHVEREQALIKLVKERFRELRYLELTTELITPHVRTSKIQILNHDFICICL